MDKKLYERFVVVPLTFTGVIIEISQLYVIPAPGTVPVLVKFTGIPKQGGEKVNDAETGFVPLIVYALEIVHPLPSVTVTVYPPDGRFEIDACVCPVFHIYVNGDTALVIVSDALPTKLQPLFVLAVVATIGILTGVVVLAAVQPSISVTVTV